MEEDLKILSKKKSESRPFNVLHINIYAQLLFYNITHQMQLNHTRQPVFRGKTPTKSLRLCFLPILSFLVPKAAAVRPAH